MVAVEDESVNCLWEVFGLCYILLLPRLVVPATNERSALIWHNLESSVVNLGQSGGANQGSPFGHVVSSLHLIGW